MSTIAKKEMIKDVYKGTKEYLVSLVKQSDTGAASDQASPAAKAGALALKREETAGAPVQWVGVRASSVDPVRTEGRRHQLRTGC
jgi:hypothetical protein